MALEPIDATLSDWQKIEVIKRFHQTYVEQLETIEKELSALLTRKAEADLMASYIADQPEVVELRPEAAEIEKLKSVVRMLINWLSDLSRCSPKPTCLRRYNGIRALFVGSLVTETWISCMAGILPQWPINKI